MSRLFSFIRRLTAQRDILNGLAGRLPEGIIPELGLGNGRTYSHLRELFPDRRIIAFDRALGVHQTCAPSPSDLVLGEICDTARAFAGRGVALVHADIGTGYPDRDAVTPTWLPGLVALLLDQGGLAISGLPLDLPGLVPLPPPCATKIDRYFLYRKTS